MDDAADIVKQAEADYSARNLEAAVSMFADDAVIIWNAREVARGKDAVREFHERFFDPAITNLTLKKTLIASSDDAIAVEWFATWVNSDGSRAEQTAAEHWFMQGNKLKEWRAFVTTKRIND